MSRGLGKMQRLILSSLDESKEWMEKPVTEVLRFDDAVWPLLESLS